MPRKDALVCGDKTVLYDSIRWVELKLVEVNLTIREDKIWKMMICVVEGSSVLTEIV